MANDPHVCWADQCEQRAIKRHLCSRHYQRAVAHGTPLPPRQPVQQRCVVDGCIRPRPYRYGYCTLHWQRMQRYGSPTLPVRQTTDQRFDAKWRLDPATGCHVWIGTRVSGGYGNFYWRPGETIRAHVYAWTRRNGPVPEGLCLDHYECDNPPCCNPEHLRAVTPAQNALRSRTSPLAVNAAKTHCIHGHEFTDENTYHPPKRPNERQCIACIRRRTRASRPRGRDRPSSSP